MNEKGLDYVFVIIDFFFTRRFSGHMWSTFSGLFVIDMKYTRPGSESQHQEFRGWDHRFWLILG